jgi:hypothetical protein
MTKWTAKVNLEFIIDTYCALCFKVNVVNSVSYGLFSHWQLRRTISLTCIIGLVVTMTAQSEDLLDDVGIM